MTLENEIETQLKRADALLIEVAAVKPTIPEYPNYGHLGDFKRFNSLLQEIVGIFGENKYEK